MLRKADRASLVPPHLSEEHLLALLDGELPRAELDIARAHVDTCWTCRSRLSNLLAGIDSFLASRTPLQPDAAAERDQRIRQFRERLAQHAAKVESQLSFGQRVRDSWMNAAAAVRHHRRPALAAAVATCLLIAIFTDVWTTKVSAETVMARATQYESTYRPKPGEVARMALRVERLNRRTGEKQPLGEVTLLHDSATAAEFISVRNSLGQQQSETIPDAANPENSIAALSLIDATLPRPIAAYLENQHWQANFSMGAFRRLIAARGVDTSTAERHGSLFALHFPFAPGHESGISEAQLIVEARNYAPVSLSLFTAAADTFEEYRFSRTTFAIEPRTTEIARLFAPSDLVRKVRSHAAPELPHLTPLTYENSQASDEEVQIAAALHKTDACLGEELHIFPMSDGTLLVQGLVDQAERRDAIRRTLLSVNPALRIQIYLPRELKSGSQLFRSPFKVSEPSAGPRSAPVATLADLSNERMPMYEELYQHFSRPGVAPDEAEKQVNAFSSEAVTLARQTFLHAWALKKLDDEFAARRTASLSAASLPEIDRMRKDHLRWIATLSHRQSDMLSQVMHMPGSSQALATAYSDSEALIRLAQEQNDLVRSLFTVSAAAPETTSTLSRLLAVLHRMGA